ncbi:MAG: flagellar basal body L-ring protein FlgH [Magnetococcales bacterium]|nr:flagellar basal body L-ring protein FlgH [Magnetococcales bacterium]
MIAVNERKGENMEHRISWKVTLLVPLVVGVSGCAGITRASARPPAPMAVVQPAPPELLAPRKGSIWQTSDRNTLFLDNKARNIGDLITVEIYEKSKAKNKASTTADRSGSNSFSLDAPLLPNSVFGAKIPLSKDNKFGGGFESKNSFAGSGATDRESELKAAVSCVVVEILANGNLRISGRQDITVDNENQFILVSGVVRPEDITPDNSINSKKIADSRIEFSGDRSDIDVKGGSWINRIFSTFN